MNYQHDHVNSDIPDRIQGLRERVHSGDAELLQPAFSDADRLAGRIDMGMTMGRGDAHVANARVLVMGFENNYLGALINMLRDAGLRSCATCKNISQLEDVSAMRGAFTHVIVNLDAFDDMDEAVSRLLLFRRRRQDTVVILISDAVKKDDLLPDRKWICDATLRAPVSPNRLCDGLSAAWVNNKALNS
ncbi:hypothetical protein GC209_13150 [bacterium]|nr:hypothetical protein [bacterium]